MNRQLLRQVRSLSQEESVKGRGQNGHWIISFNYEQPTPPHVENEGWMIHPHHMKQFWPHPRIWKPQVFPHSQLPCSSSATFVLERSSELPPPPVYCPSPNIVPQGTGTGNIGGCVGGNNKTTAEDINETEEIKIVSEVVSNNLWDNQRKELTIWMKSFKL